MKAMILAAGRGDRLRPLTDHCPKPLLAVAGQPLLVHWLAKLKKAGIQDIVINVAYLAEQIMQTIGDGQRYGVNITYSIEQAALETGGGIYHTLSYFGEAPFLVVSGDIWCDLDLTTLQMPESALAHLVLVPNPSWHAGGDFGLTKPNWITNQNTAQTWTYGNIALFQPTFFANCQPGKFPLGPLLKEAANQQKVTGEIYKGHWFNVGTHEELALLNRHLSISGYEKVSSL